MNDRRLIEDWLPMAALSEESTRERRSMTALPPTYYLHVWWARRPLVASRAAVLASFLPADADRQSFLHALGIHGDPVAARRAIDEAQRTGERVANPYSYRRAFTHSPDEADRRYLRRELERFGAGPVVLDPTAGGGSIPFEALRSGFDCLANDLNPVAALILRATVEWPLRFGKSVRREFENLAAGWRQRLRDRLEDLFPQRHAPDRLDMTYLWVRTVLCPHCAGVAPLSLNWKLAADGTGVRLLPDIGGGKSRRCRFEIVESAGDQSEGTVVGGKGRCPFPDCGRVIGGDEIKEQAQARKMGDQLFAVVFREKVEYRTKGGHLRHKWVRRFRAPTPEDDNSGKVGAILSEKMEDWVALDIVPNEPVPDGHKTKEPQRYGMALWRDLFSPRQLLCHGTSVEVFRELLEADRKVGVLTEARRTAYAYLALCIDKCVSYSTRMCLWDAGTSRVRNLFERHDFALKWSYGEMAPLVTDLGYDWAIRQTGKCIKELTALVAQTEDGSGLFSGKTNDTPSPQITCASADRLDHLDDASVDAVVMDPPYYDNVMYAELSDFFYVWLKRTAGRVFPELFRRRLTDKDSEAVANPARFAGQKGAKALAGVEYGDRMARIFAECRRVLKPDGVMTLMFTHKATGAWDALAGGLMEAGFTITASWPVATEAPGSLHIKDKAAANSTIFLVCRPRPPSDDSEEVQYWEDLEPRVAEAVRKRMEGFENIGVSRVDIYLAAFGPALEEFSRHWPVKRARPRELPKELPPGASPFDRERWDPYRATPEDALLVARREVKGRLIERLTRTSERREIDRRTDFFVMAWDAFRAPVFPYDEALKLARAAGADLDRDLVGRLCEKKDADLRLWDSVQRAGKAKLGAADGSRAAIDRLHHAAHLARTESLTAALDLLEQVPAADEPAFRAALAAVLEVLPPSSKHTGRTLKGEIESASNDFEALLDLARLLAGKEFREPRQLKLFAPPSSGPRPGG